YDSALRAFIERLLPPGGLEEDSPDGRFVRDLSASGQRLALFGYFNSLLQLTLKLTCPGVPDIYQGCELWDLSLVDPDNRRPVDFERRKQELQKLRQRIANSSTSAGGGLPSLARELLGRLTDGSIKLFTLHRLLSLRRQMPDLFIAGSYEPLAVEGFDTGS